MCVRKTHRKIRPLQIKWTIQDAKFRTEIGFTLYGKINPTNTLASGAGSESRLMSHVGRVREIVCA